MSIDYSQYPDKQGHFGIYGGIFAPETLMSALETLNDQYHQLKNDADFLAELTLDYQDYIGRPTPLYYAKRWSESLGGAKIYLKREDLNHTGAHRLTIPSVRHSWQNGWVRHVLLLKQALDNMVLPVPRLLLG